MGPASREYPKYRIPSSLSREIPLAEPSGVAMYGSSAVTSEYHANAAAAAAAIRRAPSEKVDRSEQRTGRGQTSLRIPPAAANTGTAARALDPWNGAERATAGASHARPSAVF